MNSLISSLSLCLFRSMNTPLWTLVLFPIVMNFLSVFQFSLGYFQTYGSTVPYYLITDPYYWCMCVNA